MPEKRTNNLLWIIVGGGAAVFVLLSFLALLMLFFQDRSSFSLNPNQVAIIDLEGIILDSKEFTDQLREYGKAPGTRAVVLRVNSPGGGVAASQEMYAAVNKFRGETKRKVVVSMSSVAASGGYYVACAADSIFANPGTITGSIGVMAEWYNYGELLRWAKTESIIVKSGPLKDAGSPTRPLTEAERAYFQSLIDNMYNQFVTAVATSRRMDPAAVRLLADGRVYTGQEAKYNGLIDELGTLQDAIAAAAKMAGIPGEPKVVSPPRKRFSIWDLVLGSSWRGPFPLGSDRSEANIRFQYLWR